MKEEDTPHSDRNFWWFIALVVGVALILCSTSVWLYQADGTVDLDRSLPRYMDEKGEDEAD